MQLNLFLIVVLLMNHWACVHDRINAREATAGMHESIVIERRRGLFWLINYKNEDWDCISMDT